MSTCPSHAKPARRTTPTQQKTSNAPRLLNNTLIASILRVYRKRLVRFMFGLLLSASESKAAEEGAQVDVDSGAIEDVVAVQDVLGKSLSA